MIAVPWKPSVILVTPSALAVAKTQRRSIVQNGGPLQTILVAADVHEMPGEQLGILSNSNPKSVRSKTPASPSVKAPEQETLGSAMEVDCGAEQAKGWVEVSGSNSGNRQLVADRLDTVASPTKKQSTEQVERGKKVSKKKLKHVSNFPSFQAEKVPAETRTQIQLEVNETEKDELTGEDYIVLEQTFRAYDLELGAFYMVPSIANWITATLLNKGTTEAIKEISSQLELNWSSNINKAFWRGPLFDNQDELYKDVDPPVPRRAEDPISPVWWHLIWEKLRGTTDRFLEKRRVSRNLKF